MIGVYYLWDGAQVLYIGASINVERRLRQHRRNIDFSGYFVDKCEESELRDREATAIREFKPKLNEVCALAENRSNNIGSIKSLDLQRLTHDQTLDN